MRDINSLVKFRVSLRTLEVTMKSLLVFGTLLFIAAVAADTSTDTTEESATAGEKTDKSEEEDDPPRHGGPDESDFEDMALRIMEAAYFIVNKQHNFDVHEQEQSIFIIGMPKSGKTTLTNFLTGDNTDLIAIPSADGKFEIKSKIIEKISPNSDIFPKTKTDLNNLTYITLPSLKQADYFPKDFAAGYFAKKTFENVKNVKIILTIPYSEDMFNDPNPDILNLFYYTSFLLRRIRPFKKSVSIVVTKVDRNIEFENETLTDDMLKLKITEHLVKLGTLARKDRCYNCPTYKTQDLLGCLIRYNKTQIGLFKIPSKEGVLSHDEELQEDKQNLLHMIHDDLKYVKLSPSCIRYVAFTDFRKNHVDHPFSRDYKYWYTRFFSIFMQAGQFLKMLFVFFKLDD